MPSIPDGSFSLKGGCYCTAIRYQVSFPKIEDRPSLNPHRTEGQPNIKPPLLTFDHCKDCRRASGAPVQFWNICPQEYISFSLLVRSEDGKVARDGEANDTRINISGLQLVHPSEMSRSTFMVHYASSQSVWRTFCSRCGTNISFVAYEEEGVETLMDLGIGTLDDEDLEKVGMPERHLWWNSGIGWVKSLTEEGDGTTPGDGLPKHPTGDIIAYFK
ncbi:hypothetical protein FQN53_009100 [Emmonsiellopsis sp. PD_33]|nr:hypothetical protein FQN53_009100 [Emmonsiellopsis sp. PD_33]